MLQIIVKSTGKMQIQELHGFFSHIEPLCQDLVPMEVGGDDPLYMPALRAFQNAYYEFDQLMQPSATVEASKLVIQGDVDRDSSWSGGYAYLKAMSNHPIAEVAALARKALEFYDKYGNPTKLSRNKETGILRDLIQDLQTLTEEEREKLQFDVWLNDLKDKQAAYDAALDERAEQKSLRTAGATQAARKKVEEAYAEMVSMINALIRVEGEAKYTNFVTKLNVYITEQQTELRRHATLNAKKNADGGTETDENTTEDTAEE